MHAICPCLLSSECTAFWHLFTNCPSLVPSSTTIHASLLCLSCHFSFNFEFVCITDGSCPIAHYYAICKGNTTRAIYFLYKCKHSLSLLASFKCQLIYLFIYLLSTDCPQLGVTMLLSGSFFCTIASSFSRFTVNASS